LRGIFVPMKEEVKGDGENYIMRSLIVCNVNVVLIV
jgi:hypothetical protein